MQIKKLYRKIAKRFSQKKLQQTYFKTGNRQTKNKKVNICKQVEKQQKVGSAFQNVFK